MNAEKVLLDTCSEWIDTEGTLRELPGWILASLRAAVGGDRAVLQWGDDGQVTVHGLERVGGSLPKADDYRDAPWVPQPVKEPRVDWPLYRLVAAGAAPLEPQACPADPCDLNAGHEGDHTYFEVDG